MENSNSKLNVSFMAVLQLLVVPLSLSLIISILLMGKEMNDTYNDAEKLYYETLYQINGKLVNADRDFYQAMLAAQQYISVSQSEGNLPEEVMQTLYAARLQTYNENLEQMHTRVKDAIAIAKENPKIYTEMELDGKNFKAYTEDFYELYESWLKTFDFVKQEGDLTAFNEVFETTRNALSEMTDIVENWAVEEEARAKSDIRSKVISISILFIVISIALYIAVFIVARFFAKDIKQLVGAIDTMSTGDFVTPIDEKSSVKEIRKIKSSSENLRVKLKQAIEKIVVGAENVEGGASETKNMISVSQQSIADINHAVSDLADGATSMAEDVQNAMDVTLQIGSAIDNVLESANSNLENGQSVTNESKKVLNQLTELISSGENTREKANQVSESVDKTSEAVAKISQSAALIISIASQTNLLALNASIEAARAGEAGKGFAVVAENIKNLASESNAAANAITELIRKITELSDQNKVLSEDIRNATEIEANAFSSMGNSFDDMLSLLKNAEDGNNHIVELVRTLNDNKNSILNSVESLSSISEENAASTEETSASLSMLNSNMESVVDQAKKLNDIADGLRNDVSMFKI